MLTRLRGGPRELLASVRGNIELWANLLIISWAIAFMLWQGVGFAIALGTVFGIWAILAVSLNLVVGFTGLLSVGHIGFFGIGAYATAILTSEASYDQLRTGAIPTFDWPFFAALPVGVVLAGLVAVVVGVVFNRFRDDIFVLVSFWLRHNQLQRLLELAGPYPGRIRDPRGAPSGDRRVDIRRRAGIPGTSAGVPGGHSSHLLVRSHLVVREGTHRHTRGRAGHWGVRLPRRLTTSWPYGPSQP